MARLGLLKIMCASAGSCDAILEKTEAQNHLDESRAQAVQMAEADGQKQVHKQLASDDT